MRLGSTVIQLPCDWTLNHCLTFQGHTQITFLQNFLQLVVCKHAFHISDMEITFMQYFIDFFLDPETLYFTKIIDEQFVLRPHFGKWLEI